MRNDEGSIAPLGFFAMGLTLASACVLVVSFSLVVQQRQLNTISDALALSLAQQLATSSQDSVEGDGAAVEDEKSSDVAGTELQSLQNAASRELPVLAGNKHSETKLIDLEVDQSVVRVRICEPELTLLQFNLGVLAKLPLAQVCSVSRADSAWDETI